MGISDGVLGGVLNTKEMPGALSWETGMDVCKTMIPNSALLDTALDYDIEDR